MRTILLTGASGQVGRELQRTLATLGRVVAPGHADFDLARPDTLADALRVIKPDLIVNPAAYTAVDKAEAEQELGARVALLDEKLQLLLCRHGIACLQGFDRFLHAGGGGLGGPGRQFY